MASKGRVARIGKRCAQVLLGLVVGAALAEVGFYLRDDGAFPHLNLYESDAELGVRLRPGESMDLRFGGNPVTQVRINSEGLRGAELPTPGAEDVLVVGDSQVFGLGVQENETFSARLDELLGDGVNVINAGIPTYGPPEFNHMVERMLATRKPTRVIYVVNFANDLLEADRPNNVRHAVWDGWAVRKETAPAELAAFPGRELLFRKSHAVFALRRFWYRQTGPTEAFSVPSEGTWQDIGFAAARAADEHVQAREARRRLVGLKDAKVAAANADLAQARDRFVGLVNDQQIATENVREGWHTTWNPLRAAFAQPGDIVGTDDTGEYTAPLYATAELILKGAAVRREIEAELKKRAEADAEKASVINPVLTSIHAAQERTEAIRDEPIPEIRSWSPLAPRLREVAAMCEKAGARLFVVALPIDVQVSAEEWAKYDHEPIDLSPADILIEDLVDAALAVDATPVNLMQTLRDAEPGAFLNRDIHMTPKGHEAVAKKLAEVLSQPPPVKLKAPPPGRPPGRSLPTSLSLVRNRKEVTVPGSTAAGCETYIVDEWLTVRCHHEGEDRHVPLGVNIVKVPLGEAVVYWDAAREGEPRAMVIQLPLIRDQDAEVEIRWPEQWRRLTVSWTSYWGGTTRSKAGSVTIEMPAWRTEKVTPEVEKRTPPPEQPAEEVCAAVKAAGSDAACDELPLFDNPRCLSTYAGDPAAIVSCLRGEREPGCPRGQAPVGVFQVCHALCSEDVACEKGECSDYRGAKVCL